MEREKKPNILVSEGEREKYEDLQRVRKALADDKRTFVVKVSGSRTYDIREELKSWGFFWNPEKKAWYRECVSAFEKFIFEKNIADGKWEGIDFKFKEEKEAAWMRNLLKEVNDNV